jgi:hypothetical protein
VRRHLPVCHLWVSNLRPYRSPPVDVVLNSMLGVISLCPILQLQKNDQSLWTVFHYNHIVHYRKADFKVNVKYTFRQMAEHSFEYVEWFINEVKGDLEFGVARGNGSGNQSAKLTLCEEAILVLLMVSLSLQLKKYSDS